MDKRGIRYQQAERMTTAEGKVKRLRQECDDLRKQLFRAQESARIANEEATARAVSQRQSGEALRAQLAELRATHAERVEHWTAAVRDYGAKASAFDHMPLWRIAAPGRALREVGMSTDHDRPAFPTLRVDGIVEDGITIRDYFAGKAMEKAMNEVDEWISQHQQERLAVLAYAIADAMLKARAA